MSGEGSKQEVDMGLWMKAVTEQFQLLNVRLDDIQSTNKPKPGSKRVVEEEDEYDWEEVGSRRSRREDARRDGDLSSIKMKIPSFQGKNDP